MVSQWLGRILTFCFSFLILHGNIGSAMPLECCSDCNKSFMLPISYCIIIFYEYESTLHLKASDIDN